MGSEKPLRRRTLSKKEAKELSKVAEGLGIGPLPKEGLEETSDGELRVISYGGEPLLAVLKDGSVIPHVMYLLRHREVPLPRITVDRGAVIPIGRGADVMAPGVRGHEGNFEKGDIVVVVTEEGVPIAIARALCSSKELGELKQGRVAVNLHHPGDRAWRIAERRIKS